MHLADGVLTAPVLIGGGVLGAIGVWLLLPRVAPDCADWAAYFAAGATKRALAEAGVSTVVSEREADDLVRGAHDFINLVADRLGVTRQMTLTAS